MLAKLMETVFAPKFGGPRGSAERGDAISWDDYPRHYRGRHRMTAKPLIAEEGFRQPAADLAG